MENLSKSSTYRQPKRWLKMLLVAFPLMAQALPEITWAHPVGYDEVQVDISVSGVIKSPEGDPLIGVNIRVKGTDDGVISDMDGKFQLKVPNRNAVLIISYIGYQTQEVTVAGKSVLNIVMQEAGAALDEVVVVGYGVQRKESVVGAISTVSAKDLKVAAPRSVTNILAGKISGIISIQRSGEPGKDDAQFWIRGISTSGSGKEPLVLVDGVERALNNVEPEDIESFSVLKDASATAIYGIKGANGVILVTTRRGKSGKPAINFKYEYGIQEPISTPKFVDSPTYLTLLNEARLATNPDYKTPYTPDIIAKYASGEDPWLYPNVDWMKLMMKDRATNQRFTVNASGGTEKARYFISGSFYGETGIWRTDPKKSYDSTTRLKRMNFRSNTDIELFKNMELSLGLGGYLMLNTYPGNDSGSLWYNTMLATPAQYYPTAPDPEDPRQEIYLTAGGAGNLNPYSMLVNSGYNDKWANTLQTNIALNYDFSDFVQGLKAKVLFSYDSYSWNNVARTRSGDGWKIVPPGRDPVTNELILEKTYSGNKELGYTKSASGDRRIYFQASLNYDRVFGKHGVSGLLLYNQQDYQNSDVNNATEGLPYRNMGLVARLTYNYDRKYYVEANGAYNGSENFARGHRFGLFPSIALGWLISEEGFFKDKVSASLIEYLKIRASIGLKGNDRLGSRRFAYLTTTGGGYGEYVFGKDVNTHWGSIGEDQWGADLTWETEREENIGIEARFLNGFYLQADYFHRYRTGIFQQRNSMPGIIGVQNTPWGNIGKFRNQGIDATLEYRHMFGDFQVALRSNYTFARNNFVDNDEPDYIYKYQNRKGKRLNQPFGLVAEGLFTSEEEIASSPEQTFGTVRVGDIKYKDVNGDGVISPEDEVAIGHPDIPEIVYGFGVSLAYKGIDCSVFFQGAANMDFMLGGDGFFPFLRGEEQGNVTYWATDRWTLENPRQDALFPRLSDGDNPNNYRSSTWWQRSANYLRLKTVEVGYTFPKTWTSKAKISTLRIYLSGLNLCTFSKFKYWDPELGNGNGSAYPIQRNVSLGVNLNF